MGFNKCFLPPIETMKNDILINGLEQFIKKYGKLPNHDNVGCYIPMQPIDGSTNIIKSNI